MERRNQLADGEPANESVFDTVSADEVDARDWYFAYLEKVVVSAQILWGDVRTRFGFFVVLGYVLMGTVGVVLVPPPNRNVGPLLVGPFETMAHPLGTTDIGTDLLSLIVHATPFMLKMMLAGGLFTTVVAVVLGLYAGYSGGRVDRVLSTLADVALVIPGLPLFIVLSVVISPTSAFTVGIILAVNRWGGLARQVRSEVLSLRSESYVEASRALGMNRRRILYYDILPNIMPFVLIRFINAAKGIVYASVALYFLGILPSTGANWGVTMNKAYSSGNALSRPEAFHWMLAPMVAVVLLSLGLVAFSQGADRLFNARIRARMRDDERG